MKKLCKDSPIPLYYQLKELIHEEIEDEVYRPGDPIPTEKDLCAIYGISRMTVNKAIMCLVNEGLLYRLQGKGTFVAEYKKNHQLNQLKGFTDDMSGRGFKVETKILSFITVVATKNKRFHLNLEGDQNKLIEMRRLRLLDNEPHSLETVWIPLELCPDLKLELIEGNSLYSVFRDRYKYVLATAKQTIEPIAISDYESELLRTRKNSLALLFRRTTSLDDGRIIEYTKAIYRSDKFKYELMLNS